jgi:peroxiredoxin
MAACQTNPDEGIQTAPEVGAFAPEFTLVDTADNEVALSDHRGKVVLINFWATWCPPCRQEMPGIQSRHAFHNGDLAVLAIDNAEPKDLVVAFRDELSLGFEPLLDSNGKVSNLYQVRAFPTSMFVNEHGIIQFVHIGFMTESQLDDYLAQMGLGEETASQ